MSEDKKKEFTHDLINKLVSAQGYMKVLGKKEVPEKQRQLLENAITNLGEGLEILKKLRKTIE